MRVKKINSVLSIFTIVAIIIHIAFSCRTLLTGWYSKEISHTLPMVLYVIVGIHAVLSMYIVFFVHDESSAAKYKKQNMSLIIQRISAVMMLVMLHPHITIFSQFKPGATFEPSMAIPTVLIEAFFYISVLAHIATSVPKCVVSLGLLRSEESLKIVRIISNAVCAIIFIFTLVALIVCVVRYI